MSAGGSTETLVRMANQIGAFFVTQPGDTAVLHTADHIHAFWSVKMKNDLLNHIDHGGSGLTPAAAEAMAIIKKRSSKTVERALHMKGEDAPGHEPGDDAG